MFGVIYDAQEGLLQGRFVQVCLKLSHGHLWIGSYFSLHLALRSNDTHSYIACRCQKI